MKDTQLRFLKAFKGLTFIRRAVCLLFGLAAMPAFAIVCSTDPNQAIPDGSGNATPGAPATANIVVPAGVTAPISDLNFQLQINHTYVGDLIVTLTSPAGTVVTLVDRPGSPAPLGIFGCSSNNINTTLDDEAATLVEDQCDASPLAIGGTHQPTGLLSAFDGESLAGTWVVSVTDNAGADTGTLISAGACLDQTTTPVTIGSFKSRLAGNSIIAKWQTSSEAFNLGFNLWGLVDDQWTQLNRKLIGSRSFDSLVPQRYRRRVRLAELDGELTQIGISAFSTTGQEDFFGPFEIGQQYGDEDVPRYIDWAEQRIRYDQGMRDAGYIKLRGRWVRATARKQKRLARQRHRFPDTVFSIVDAGVYRVSYEDLRDMGYDLNRMPIAKMALSRQGRAIPRIINPGRNGSRRFGPGASIIFYAQGAKEGDARYVADARYTLSLNPELVLLAPDLTTAQSANNPLQAPLIDLNTTVVNYHVEQKSGGVRNSYSFVLPGNDPWYDSLVQAFGQIQSKVTPLIISEDALFDQPVGLSFSLLGGVDFTNIDANNDGNINPDHHYKIYVNRSEFPAPLFEGFSDGVDPIDLQISVASDQLKIGENLIEFELIPDNGFNIDAVFFIDASIDYAVPNRVVSGFLDIEQNAEADWLTVDDAANRIEHIYRYDQDGNFAKVAFRRDAQTIWLASQNNPSARSATHLWLAGSEDYLVPDGIYRPSAIAEAELDLSDIDYVVISDPSLIGEDLQRFVARQDELGRRTKVINSDRIFAAYSDGLVLPEAITRYLSDQADESPFQYVLLVGGHTYNYRHYGVTEENQPINLIPGFYRPTGTLIKQTPTEVPFVDFDNNGTPDRAIGRWPVRDKVQLKKVVDKTLLWHAQGSHANSQTALFIAGEERPLNNFTDSFSRISPSIGEQFHPWQEVPVFMDVINQDDSILPAEKINSARQSIVQQINQGAALTIFSGHASATRWSFQNLVTADVADLFTNTDKPSLMMPLACYTSYYETPNVRSLAESLFSDSSAGAVGITSAAVISKSSDNERMAKRLLEEMTTSGSDLGTAVLKVKQRLHAASPEYQSLIYNWTTLADPTLSFGLPEVTPEPVIDNPKP